LGIHNFHFGEILVVTFLWTRPKTFCPDLGAVRPNLLSNVPLVFHNLLSFVFLSVFLSYVISHLLHCFDFLIVLFNSVLSLTPTLNRSAVEVVIRNAPPHLNYLSERYSQSIFYSTTTSFSCSYLAVVDQVVLVQKFPSTLRSK
jgi:hypothetical protein